MGALGHSYVVSTSVLPDIYIYNIGALNGPIRSLRRGGLYIDIPPNNPPLVLGMLVGCVATDTISNN